MKLVSKDGTQSIDFEIPEKYKRILICCSGGADSTMALYLLNLYFQETKRVDTEIIIVTATCIFGAVPANAIYAQTIVHKIMEFFPDNLINYHHIFYKGEIENIEVVFKDAELKILGDSANPKFLSKKYINDLTFISHRHEDRDYDEIKDCWDTESIMRRQQYRPFWCVDKKFIADMYDHFELRESLLPLTWSCTVEGTEHNENYTKHCGFCWWCKERDWAFNYEDEQYPTKELYKNNP